MFIPKEIIIYIYSFDPTFKKDYDKCISIIKQHYDTHSIIRITYNNSSDEYKLFFKRYNNNFYKYFLLNL
jgi:hypothetical protein